MLSNGSSAPSSRGEANVDFDGDERHQQAHSSASSGFEHEEVLATKPTTAQPAGGLEVDSKNAEVFTTPRSSSEQEKLAGSADTPSASQQTKEASSLVATETDVAAPHDAAPAEHAAVAAPAIPGAMESSPSIPNAVRFLQPIKGEIGSKSANDSPLNGNATSVSRQASRRLKNASTDTTGASANGGAVTRSSSAAGGWGLEEELQIVDKVQNATVTSPSKAQKPPRASLDKNRKSLDAASKAHFKNNVLMNIINEDESDEVKAAAREAGIPEGSYAIHPPSMLQLFEASQCLVYNEDGQEVLFGDIYKKRRTLVCFLRHWWCGFCQQFAMSVRNIDPLPLKKANLDFVIVGQGDWHVIKAYREVMQVQYPMFADPKRNVYRALGMTLRTNDANPACARPDYASMGMTKGILVAIKKGLFDMPIRNPGDMKLLGGDFILGPGLQCSFTHRMTTADGHMDIPRILAQAGCDMSLKTPKPLFMLDEKATRSATLAGGNQNRRQTRSIGRSRSKKKNLDDVNTMDSTFGNTTGSVVAAGSVGHAGNNPRSRPSLWGRFPGRFSKSQVSLPASMSQADVSTDQSHDRGFAAEPRSASAMRVRESFDTQNTGIEFESRATSFDTRRRPSDVAGPGAFGFGTLKQASSMSELRKRFEMGGLSSFRSKLRQDPSKVSLDGRLAVPGSGNSRLQHNASTKSLRVAAQANGVNEATTPTQKTFAAAKQVNGAGDKAVQLAPSGLTVPAAAVNGRSSMEAPPSPRSPGFAPPGSFLEDLDVYDSMSSLKDKAKPNGDSSEPASSVADHGSHDTPLGSTDMEPSLSGTQTPTGSQRAAPLGEGGHTQGSSFQSFNAYRAQPLEHLVEETDEDGDDSRDRLGHDTEDSETDETDEDNDEPIEFESGLSGRF
uniref:Thioredoxin domain-containing protein n=1 Tax=Kalmanozyma brasiliensis (strain GHG001) TaxID=1365824 RepID=V5GF31_KALBG